jgi:DNA-binding LacI/PurR family transcriptional regulator
VKRAVTVTSESLRGKSAPRTREEVAGRLRALVAGVAPGARFPTVRQLMAEFGVSQHLIQGAMDELRQEGVISSHVGRGTFVSDGPGTAHRTRSVLTLLYQHPYQRGDVIARIVHQRLSIEGHESLTLTYSNAAHVMELLKSGVRYDAAILQPRSSTMSVSLLALLKQRADHVLVEGHAAEHLDVDAVSNDPEKTVDLLVSHLFERGHRRIAWIREDCGNFFFDRTAAFFRTWCRGAGLSAEDCPVIDAEADPTRFGMRDLAAVIAGLKGARRRLPFTAIVVASFVDGRTIIDALARSGLDTPRDVAVARLGTPDLDSDHLGRITIAGRPSTRAANTVLERLQWRWSHPTAPYQTYFDVPELVAFDGTAG